VQAMDALPIPKFGDFFRQAECAGVGDKAYLAVESARGCWWGAKSHCKFCGLNGNSMAFRAKSGDRTAHELRQLREEYGVKRFFMTDNILDMRYFESLLPLLEQDGMELFYEIKSNLKREHVEQLARAGVRWVQPGVESLDSETLRLIAKGVSAIQNIQLLKWCKEAGIKPFWNILYGFPGEQAETLERIAALCPALLHLPPPMQVAPFQLHRFSPYYSNASRYGIEDVRPAWGYRFAYAGLSADEVAQVAYCFEFEGSLMAPPRSSLDMLFASAANWMSAAARQANLCLVRTADGATVYDSRAEGTPLMDSLSELELQVLDHLCQARKRAQVLNSFPGEAKIAVESLLQRFCERNWVIELDGQLLSIVLDYSWASGIRETGAAATAWL
jgi:ribosomal peptide maturation radical SAM protein 1